VIYASRAIYACRVIAERLRELEIVLPAAFPSAGNYLTCVVEDGMVYVGGHGPIDGDTMIRGRSAPT
jgi:hypothetical protein